MATPFPTSSHNPQDHTQPPSVPYPATSNGMGLTGFITGLIGACLAWVPIIGFILGVVGIVFSGIGLHNINQGRANNKGMSIAGLVLGVLAVLSFPLFIVIYANAHHPTR